MLSAIFNQLTTIGNFFSALFSFISQAVDGVISFVRMLPSAIEAIGFFSLAFPAWVLIPFSGLVSVFLALAVIRFVSSLLPF